MSKAQLKKELLNLDKDQLVELVLEAYSARKETKEYFEFYLDPDIRKLRSKYESSIFRELNRGVKRRAYSKARISTLKKLIKEFRSFHPGFEAEIDLLMYTVETAVEIEAHVHYPDTLVNGIANFCHEILTIADENQVFANVVDRLMSLLNDERQGSKYFRRFLRQDIESVSSSLSVPSRK